jgi:hypothetical protein
MMFGYRILRLFANIVIEAPWLASGIVRPQFDVYH